jgi:stearoyl-CoA desaturase (delta-9 desaturase)
MMWETKHRYDDFAYGRREPDVRFAHATPSWPLLERFSQNWLTRVGWIAGYSLFYVQFATQAWMFALLPLHFVMGPIHGAIVNWCGHRYGYRNYASNDDSTNAFAIEFITWGELFQNNHHRFAMSPKFSARRFELDPTWYVIRALSSLGIIRLAANSTLPVWPDPEPVAVRPRPSLSPAE